ncbi:hypothetical protein BZG36_04000 [Bifiguratus adelaidae]|uniref:Endoplasmic reticulum vesicle transporter C-terminal domain-containing protein n=1 Tax=Bifiguratus adelaidae TaxID=1938954 RepID=A0A261XYI8_9FUNG|nr:hypothetical protein BZG36_04000 [Bifiguratus adelaidae]
MEQMPASSSTLRRRFAEKITHFDAFPKVETENQAKSEKGGAVTVMLVIMLSLLVLGEIIDYRRLTNTYEFLVDPQVVTEIQINVDMTVAMPCAVLTVDLRDESMAGMHLSQNLQMTPAVFQKGSAKQLGAVKTKKMRVHKIIKDAKKTADESVSFEESNGCRISGHFQVNKVAGNLHITALGHGYGQFHTEHSAINFTHRIDEFSFGPFYPSLVNPLDNSVEMSESNFESFQYFISVVPTVYVDYRDNVLLTNQYSVTDYRKSFDPAKQQDHLVPGIFFRYEIEPISVRIRERRKAFTNFLVRLCGIIGGAFVSVGFLYRVFRFLASGGKDVEGINNIPRSVSASNGRQGW